MYSNRGEEHQVPDRKYSGFESLFFTGFYSFCIKIRIRLWIPFVLGSWCRFCIHFVPGFGSDSAFILPLDPDADCVFILPWFLSNSAFILPPNPDLNLHSFCLWIQIRFSIFYSPPRPRMLWYYLYRSTAWSASPQTTLWGIPEFTSLEISNPGAPRVHPRFFRVTLG